MAKAYIVWRKWADGSMTSIGCRSYTGLKKTLGEKTKAVEQWTQTVEFSPENCQQA